MASGEPEDFFVRRVAGDVAFEVRTGDGAPYTVYLSEAKAAELACGIDAVLTTECQRPDCKLARQALDTAVGRAEEVLKDLRGACADLDAIVCVENDTRHELGMPPKEDE